VIDYRRYLPVHEQLTEKFGKEFFGVAVGARGVQDLFHTCPNFLKPGKPYVTVGLQPSSYTVLLMLNSIDQMISNSLWPRILGRTDRAYIQVTGLANLKDLEILAEMAENGKLKVPIDSQRDFAEVQKVRKGQNPTLAPAEFNIQAYERMLSKHAKGKVVVNVETV
jgi:NADPH:quinone reductase-like Zn-dependent oxidoreductase